MKLRTLLAARVAILALTLYRRGWPRSTRLLLSSARAVGIRPLRIVIDGRDLG